MDNVRTNFCVNCKDQADRIEALEAELASVTEDRDLWKQSEASCSAQYDKLQAEVARLEARCAKLVNHIKDNCSRSHAFLAGRDMKGSTDAE